MQKLKPFQGTLPFVLEAELLIQGPIVTVTYRLSSSPSIIGKESASAILGLPETDHVWTSNQVQRRNELWKTTCFEAFLKPVGQESYYELNFSLSPAWNAYEFQGYRSPQPPAASAAFDMKKLDWDPRHSVLTVLLENKCAFTQFNVSLTAVVETRDQSKHYLAVTHAEEKPDFHSVKSFTLLRGNT